MALGLLSQSYVTFIALIYVYIYTEFIYGTVMAKVMSLPLAGRLMCEGNLKEKDGL